jgi:uncharacterized protein (DUF924 family)
MKDFVDILRFWFEEISPQQWFKKDAAFDRLCAERFGQTLLAASVGECYSWRYSPEGRLAEIIVLDQFSRNIYRDTPQAFAQDSMALALAQEAVHQGIDKVLDVEQNAFLYMPYMHSESVIVHEQAVKLFAQPGYENKYEYELRHKEIIDRFGRYPHRNSILGRTSTDEELAFLDQPGSSF